MCISDQTRNRLFTIRQSHFLCRSHRENRINKSNWVSWNQSRSNYIGQSEERKLSQRTNMNSKKKKANYNNRGNTRGYKSRLGLALHLIGCVRCESFLDQSDRAWRSRSRIIYDTQSKIAPNRMRGRLSTFIKNIQLPLHLQVCLRKLKRLNWSQNFFFLPWYNSNVVRLSENLQVSAVLVKLLQGSA